VAIYYPAAIKQPQPFWMGTLDALEKQLPVLLDSPVRKDLIQRILEGDSVVWILLMDKEDTSSKSLVPPLEEYLMKVRMEQLSGNMFSVPTEAEAVAAENATPGLSAPVTSFSVLPLYRNDPAEEFLCQSIQASSPALAKEAGPFLIPVFGRGRMLAPIRYQETNRGEVALICRLLCGPCFCDTKDANPGVDLLLSVSWDELIAGKTTLANLFPNLIDTSVATASVVEKTSTTPRTPIEEPAPLLGSVFYVLSFLFLIVLVFSGYIFF